MSLKKNVEGLIKKGLDTKYKTFSDQITLRNYSSKGVEDMFDTTTRSFSDAVVNGLVRGSQTLFRNKVLYESLLHSIGGVIEQSDYVVFMKEEDVSGITLNKETTIIVDSVEYTVVAFMNFENEKLCLITKMDD